MAQHKVVVCCWNKGHMTDLAMTLRQEQGLDKKIANLKAVCPTCRNDEEGNQAIFIYEGETTFTPKTYKCRHGHVTCVRAFTNGMLNVTFGYSRESFFNIEGLIEELEELVDKKDISCHHVKENGRRCDCKLKPIDNFTLEYPGGAGIKTKTRVGDLWDKAGAEPVRSGNYDKDGYYHGTKSETANRERLKRMRKRNMSEEKHPGKRITKATKRSYDRRSKNEVNPERLK